MICMTTESIGQLQSGFPENKCPECGENLGVVYRLNDPDGLFVWFECIGAGRCIRLLRNYRPSCIPD